MEARFFVTEQDHLLPRVKRTLARWTHFGWPDGGRLLRDADGTPYAILTRHRDGEWFAFAAKKQLLYGKMASFMPRLAKQARDSEAVLVLFVGEDPTIDDAWVFDPKMVLVEGEERTVRSKRRSNVYVLDLEAERFGVNLGDYLAGVKTPRTPNERRPANQMVLSNVRDL